MKRKLLLVNPVNPRRKGLAANPFTRFPPLSLGIIAALTPEDWDVEIADENFEAFRYREADLVGFTAFTSSANRAYEIAHSYLAEGIQTVMGGIHASLQSEEALQHMSTVVIGEAEGIWGKVIGDFESGKMQPVYQGDFVNVRDIPKPRRELFSSHYLLSGIQTTRGCPMDCAFCSVTTFNGRQYRLRPVEDVLDELETIPQKMLFIVDDNIIGFGKHAEERALSLFQGIVDRGIRKDWICQASMNFADNEEVLAYAAKSGCRLVILGVETERKGALSQINKQVNISKGIRSYEHAFQRINRFGIAVVGAFIYGMDDDSREDLLKRTNFILDSSVDAVQTTCLTPLPGTRLFNKFHREKRLLYMNYPDDWIHYDLSEVTYKPMLMNKDELQQAFYVSNKRLYRSGEIFRKFLKTWITTRSFITAMWAYITNANYRNVVLDTENSAFVEALYRILLRFSPKGERSKTKEA